MKVAIEKITRGDVKRGMNNDEHQQDYRDSSDAIVGANRMAVGLSCIPHKTRGDIEKIRQYQNTVSELEKLCLDLVTGMDALSSLLIEHHAYLNDGTGSLICNVCASKTGKCLWKESDTQKQKWRDWQKKAYGKPF